jgi:hypothetical protein
LPFTLATGPSSQVMSWSSPAWSHDSMSCLMCNELLHHMCELCNISKSFHLHGIDCPHMMYLWTNHLCISYLNTFSSPKVVTQLKPNKDLSPPIVIFLGDLWSEGLDCFWLIFRFGNLSSHWFSLFFATST